MLSCGHCENFDRNPIIPKRYSTSDMNLCVPCYNFYQFQRGLPYVCSKCHVTQLKMKTPLCCFSCDHIDSTRNKGIPKINYKSQSIYKQLVDEFANKVYIHNFSHLSKYYKFDDGKCEVFMSDIPKKLIEYCQNNGYLTYDEVVDFIEGISA